MVSAVIGLLAAAFVPGDTVPFMRRTQYEGQRTDWHDLPVASQPHFLRDRTTRIEHVPNGLVEPYKISLALSGLQFVTPWITVSDGSGRFLSHLELRLTASGNDISALRWEMQYVDEEPPPHITVRTVWEEALEHDLGGALGLVFAVAALASIVVLWLTCARDSESALAILLGDESAADAELQHHEPGVLHGSARGSYRDATARKYL